MKRLWRLSIALLWLSSFLVTNVSPALSQDWQSLSPDIDGDGLLNDQESNGWYSKQGGPFQTDPRDADSDDDGLTDGEEKLFDTDPLDDQSPGIYVRYQDTFYTKEYFRTAEQNALEKHPYPSWEPDNYNYITWREGGNKRLLTEAIVVRRGTTFHIGGPHNAKITIDGNGYTSLVPTVVGSYDLYGGGWEIEAPANGRVGIFTATLSIPGESWTKSMPLYVIFELPTPTSGSLPLEKTLTAQAVQAFAYNDDAEDIRDETAVIWMTRDARDPNSKYSRRCDEGYDPPCYDADNFYQVAVGFSQAFFTEHYKKFILLDRVLWRIHGLTQPWDAVTALLEGADQEVRVNYANFGQGLTGQPASYQIPYVLLRHDDGTGETQTGTACHAQAGTLTTFLRAAGVPARPFITDWNWHQYDTSVLVWLNDQWYAARSYTGAETSDTYKYYPFARGYTAQTYLSNWDNRGSYREDISNLLITANEQWDWEMVNTGRVYEDYPTVRSL